MRTLPILGSQQVQTGILMLTRNAEGYEGRIYDMPPSGADGARLEDLHPRVALGGDRQ